MNLILKKNCSSLKMDTTHLTEAVAPMVIIINEIVFT